MYFRMHVIIVIIFTYKKLEIEINDSAANQTAGFFINNNRILLWFGQFKQFILQMILSLRRLYFRFFRFVLALY